MEIKRDIYLQRLIDREWNGMVKAVTGIRRCGKSYLLFRLFKFATIFYHLLPWQKNNSIFALILRSEQIIPFAVFDNDSDNVHKMMYKSVMFSQFRFHQPIH